MPLTASNTPMPTPGPTETAALPPPTFGPNVTLYRGNVQRTGVYDVPAIRQQPDVKWQTQVGSMWLMPPLVTDGVLYTGGGNGWLYAFDAQTGERMWAAGGFGQMESTGAIAGDVIIAGGYAKRVQALDRRNGNVLWSFNTRHVVQASPLIVDAQVYIATDHFAYALDLETGQLKWEAATGDEDAFMGGPAYEEGAVYTTGGRLLLALDSATGKERWRAERDTPFTALAVANQLVYVGNTDHYFRAYDQQTGEESWKFQAQGEFWSAPAIDKNIVYVGNSDQFVYALDAQTAEQLWAFKTAGRAVSEPVVADGVVYVSDSNHEFPRGPRHVYALDALTGEELWMFETLSTFLPAPALGEGLIYATITGEVFALK
jgi:outer membrane protein assembly factor BamB